MFLWDLKKQKKENKNIFRIWIVFCVKDFTQTGNYSYTALTCLALCALFQ